MAEMPKLCPKILYAGSLHKAIFGTGKYFLPILSKQMTLISQLDIISLFRIKKNLVIYEQNLKIPTAVGTLNGF